MDCLRKLPAVLGAALLVTSSGLFSGCTKSEKDLLADESKIASDSSMNRDLSELRKQLGSAKDDFQRSEIYGKISSIESEKGDVGSAIRSANESIKFYPGSAKSHYLLGKSYLSSGRYPEAEIELQTAVGIDAKFAPAHFELGNLYYKMRKYNDSISEYKLTVKYDPNYYQAYNNLGAVYQQTNKLNEAEASFLKTREINPRFAGVYKNLGILYDTRMNRKPEAKTAYQEYLRRKPNAADRAAVKIWIANLGK